MTPANKAHCPPTSDRKLLMATSDHNTWCIKFICLDDAELSCPVFIADQQEKDVPAPC